MNISFFGSSLVSSFWNGAATYYRGIVRALAERGHHLTFFEPDALQRQQHRDMADPEWARVVVYPASEAGVEDALQQAAGSDILIKASGVGVFDELLERRVLDVASARNKTAIFWDVDAPATLERVQMNEKDAFRPLISQYDMVFTYGGGPPVVNAYRTLGARECIPVYNALDPQTHHPVTRDGRFEGLLGLLANRMPDREQRIYEFFFRAAEHLPMHNFVLGGSGWHENVPMLRNVRYVGHVYTQDHNAFNSTPLALLNVNRESMARFGYSPPTRIFEAAGAAACLITDEWPGIDMFLEPGREVLVAADGLGVARHLEGLTSERASRIGSAARARILAEHTYQHRAELVEAVLQGAVV